jgi:hypothetical protein
MMPYLFQKNLYICNMKANKNKDQKMVQVPEAALLSLVADKLKDRVLFPEKIEAAKEYLRHAKVKKA